MGFPERLKELRTQSGLSQKTVAENCNITSRQYQRYEASEQDITLSKLLTLADYFNVSLDYLTGRTDNPDINK